MKLSNDTISILKNFASINSNLVFREGNCIKTISEAKNIMASANIEELIPMDFGIYDMGEFLSVLDMMDDPEIAIKKDRINISSSNQRVQYFTAPENILTSPSKDINMPTPEVAFNLSNSVISSLKRAASTFGVDDVVIRSDGGPIHIDVTSNDNPTSNVYTVCIDQSSDDPFRAVFNINNFRFMPGDYVVNVSSRLISTFQCKEERHGILYYVALEKNSTFG